MFDKLKQLIASRSYTQQQAAHAAERCERTERDEAGLVLVPTDLDWDALYAEGLISESERRERKLRPLISR